MHMYSWFAFLVIASPTAASSPELYHDGAEDCGVQCTVSPSILLEFSPKQDAKI